MSKILGSLILLSLPLWLIAAQVRVYLDENPIILGETALFGIEAKGNRVVFPQIDRIEGFSVESEGLRRYERLEGNQSVVTWEKLYRFTPTKSLHIPSFPILIDGVRVKTQGLDLKVQPAGRKVLDGLAVALEADRKVVYVAQPIDITVRFKERRDLAVMSVDFVPMRSEHFWGKRVGRVKRYAKRNFLIHEQHYLLFPQKSGRLRIGPAIVKVAVAKRVRDAFGFIVQRPKWLTLRSQVLAVDVKALPSGVDLVGDFRWSVKVSSKEVEANKPVEMVVEVKATAGNIEDFRMPRLQIAGVTIYDQAPKIVERYEHGVYEGIWRRKYLLIADRNFTIEKIEIPYFNPHTGRIERLKSEAIPIVVMPNVKESQAVMEDVSERWEDRSEWYRWLLFGLLAFLAGMGVMYGWFRLSFRKRVNKEAKNPKGHTQMLQRLLPYISTSKEAAQMAENLYAVTKEDKKIKVDPKVFSQLLKRLESRRGDQRIS